MLEDAEEFTGVMFDARVTFDEEIADLIEIAGFADGVVGSAPAAELLVKVLYPFKHRAFKVEQTRM